MKEALKILWEMQKIRQQREKLVASKRELDSAEVQRLWQQIKLLKQAVIADQESLSCLEKVCARQEADLESVTVAHAEIESRLYSGEISDCDELQEMRGKCECTKTDIATREDEVVFGLEQCEKLTVNIIKQQQMIDDRKLEHAKKQREVVQALNVIDQRIIALDEQYNALAAKVGTDLLKIYKELERKHTQPIASLENGMCSGCRRTVPTSQLHSSSQEIIYCDNCGRILLLNPEIS